MTVKVKREPRTTIILTIPDATVIEIDKLAASMRMTRAASIASTVVSHFGPKPKAKKGAGR